MLGPVLNGMNEQKKSQIEHIIFNQIQSDPNVVSRLPHEDKKIVQQLLAQKIAYETINEPLLAVEQTPYCGPYLSKAFFCFYPQTCVQNFNLNSDTFFQRCFRPFQFWRSDFLSINAPIYDLYGPLWISITYACILAISGNIAAYWINNFDKSYTFQSQLVFRAFGVVFLFSLMIPCALSGVISLMNANLPIVASICMYGYSQLLFILPVFLCSFPSLSWQIGILILSGIINAVFLLRNYYNSTKQALNNNVYPLLVCIITFQILYLVIVKQAFFIHNEAYLPSVISANTTISSPVAPAAKHFLHHNNHSY